MKLTIFAKTAHKKDGSPFVRFIAKMYNKKTGENVTVNVRTVQDIPQFSQKKCPYNIEFSKEDANLSERAYQDRDGNNRTSYTLWLKNYKESSEKYVDHSLDEFE